MSSQWGSQDHKKRQKEQAIIQREERKNEAGLITAAIAVTIIYVLVMAGGSLLKSQIRSSTHGNVQANPGPVTGR